MKVKSMISLGLVILVVVLVSLLALFGVKYGLYRIDPLSEYVNFGMDLRGGVYAVYTAENDGSSEFDALKEETMETVQSRLTAAGYTTATMTKQDDNRIRVEIPNVSDPGEIFEEIGRRAHLEIVDPDGNVVITGADIMAAQATYADQTSQEPVVAFQLTAEGTTAFAEATAKNIGNTLNIQLDGETISSPTVNSAIPTGQGVITMGGATGAQAEQSAINLAALISYGELPLTLTIDEVSPITATLGVGVLGSSLRAGIIGFVLVLLFMLAVYRLPGLVADIALCAYVLIVSFTIALTPSIQLSLPSVVGILMGIGMAVNANCTIFERFREERMAGRSLRDSAKNGYKNALRTVTDTHVVVIVGALVLMFFGTGFLKGFAITLFIGAVASYLTTVIITRFLLDQVIWLSAKNNALYVR